MPYAQLPTMTNVDFASHTLPLGGYPYPPIQHLHPSLIQPNLQNLHGILPQNLYPFTFPPGPSISQGNFNYLSQTLPSEKVFSESNLRWHESLNTSDIPVDPPQVGAYQSQSGESQKPSHYHSSDGSSRLDLARSNFRSKPFVSSKSNPINTMAPNSKSSQQALDILSDAATLQEKSKSQYP